MGKVNLPTKSVIIANLGLTPNGAVQKYFQETCYRYMDKYVPYRTGQLAYKTVDLSNPQYIIYDVGYAEIQYKGERKGKPIVNRKSPGHEYAGSYWDKRMWSAEGQDVVKEIQNYFNTRGGK